MNLNDLSKYLPNQREEAFRLFRPIMEIVNSFQAAPLNITAQILEIMQQLGKIRVETIEEKSRASTAENLPPTKQFVLHLEKLMTTDPTEDDRHLGICAVPLLWIFTKRS
jgi:CHAD domain-containing protein